MSTIDAFDQKFYSIPKYYTKTRPIGLIDAIEQGFYSPSIVLHT